jgi:hypothetical protein
VGKAGFVPTLTRSEIGEEKLKIESLKVFLFYGMMSSVLQGTQWND